MQRRRAVDYKIGVGPADVDELLHFHRTLPYQPALGYSENCGNAKAFSMHRGVTEAQVLVHAGDYLWEVVAVYRNGEKAEDHTDKWEVSSVV